MDTSLFKFPDALSFAEISHAWSQCPGAPDEEEIQAILVRAMWRGAFERDGEPLTFVFRRPENQKLPDGSIIRYAGDANRTVTRSVVRQQLSSNHSDEESRGGTTPERERIPLSRAMILEVMHYFRPKHSGDAFASLTFDGMVDVSLAEYDPDARAAYLDHLRLSPTDLAAWFSSAPVDWPRPAWLGREAGPAAPMAPPNIKAGASGDKQIAPLKPRGPGRPNGGPDDDALIAELRRWPADENVNYSKIARRIGGPGATKGRLASLRRRAQFLHEKMTAPQFDEQKPELALD